MPGRDPDSAARSARVADAIRAEMRRQGLTGAELRKRLEAEGVTVPNAMWVTRRLTGQVNLVEPERVVYGPTIDLRNIANALNVEPKRLIRTVNTTRKPADKPAA